MKTLIKAALSTTYLRTLSDRPSPRVMHQRAQRRDWAAVGVMGAFSAGVWLVIKAVGI